MNISELLASYRSLWINRKLPVEDGEEKTLLQAIKKDLKDELTHPRLRKNSADKFLAATKRIMNSSLEDNVKLHLIKLHLLVLDEVKDK
ncbi:hypothetical protein [Metabacillus arenae]|uniref:YojE n=1 Tax=Metabacillus arenae TaxID=2771434 RepID=A0A926RVZ7_9BACI|nr:hypothetical protein [Metabacillus arenae]MBD1379025.1 hypothetical protein [Metabacillus arenae]